MALSREEKEKEKLMDALYDGDLLTIKNLAESNPQSLTTPLNTGKRETLPTYLACESGHLDIVQFLLEKVLDLEQILELFNLATQKNDLTCVKILVEANALGFISNEMHPIFCAAWNGCFSLVKFYLDRDKTLLNKTTKFNYTLATIAAIEGNKTLLDYLIGLKADLSIETILEDEDYDHFNGFIALDWATAKGRDQCVESIIKACTLESISKEDLNYLLHLSIFNNHLNLAKFYLKHTSLKGNDAQLISFIHEARRLKQWDIAALLFLKSDRSLELIQEAQVAMCIIKKDKDMGKVILQDRRLYDLIHASKEYKVNKDILSAYSRRRGRSRSTYTIVNEKTFDVSVFKPKKALGEGRYGHVRLFTDKSGATRAIKVLTDDLEDDSSRDEINKITNEVEAEKQFLEIINSVKHGYDSFHFLIKEKPKSFYSGRIIMPFFGKKNPKLAFAEMTCVYQLAKASLALANELQRIHGLGIIHGDVKNKNIIMDPEIYFIDCGLSYRITDSEAPTYELDPDEKAPSNHAPERFYRDKKPVLLPNPNQDVYSLGDTLNDIFKKHPRREALIKTFPCILEFIQKATLIDPNSRPALTDFCKKLSEDINQAQQVIAMNLNKESLIEALIKGDLYTIEIFAQKKEAWLTEWLDSALTQPIHVACQLGYFNIVEFILERKPYAVNFSTKHNRTGAHLASFYGHLEILKHLIKRKAVLNIRIKDPDTPCHDGLMPIHFAAMNGHTECVKVLIAAGALLNQKNLLSYIFHTAIENKHLELMKYCLEKKPDLININIGGETPVIIAARSGAAKILNYLIFTCRAEFKSGVISPKNKTLHGKTAIESATENDNLHCVKILIKAGALDSLRLNHPEHPIQIAANCGYFKLVKLFLKHDPSLSKKCDIFKAIDSHYWDIAALLFLHSTCSIDFIQDAPLALSIIKLKPEKCSELLQDKRIYDLIHAFPECQIDEESIHRYQTKRGRSLSSYQVISKKTYTPSLFKRGKELGFGRYGDVSELTNENGEQLAVKARLENLYNKHPETIKEIKKDADQEMRILSEIYPAKNNYHIFHVEFQENGHSIYNNRIIMPLFKGIHPTTAFEKITDVLELAKKVYSLSEELLRIHRLHIIHGDIKNANILVDDNTFHFVDCEVSYRMNGTPAPTFKLGSNGEASKSHAPERFYRDKETVLLPNPNQDIFSFGKTLEDIFKNHPMRENLMEAFPCIAKFIKESMSIKPQLRPMLEDFCRELLEEINHQKPSLSF